MKTSPDFDSNSDFFSVYQRAHLLQYASEKGELQEEKDKLQTQVEDLTRQLQLEKRLKIELEEAKGKEILELQNSLQAMQAKVNVKEALLTMDRESAEKKIDKLSASMEELKSFLESDRKFKQGESSEIKQQKLEEAENRPNQLQESINRLEEKLTNIESENKVLREQAFIMAAELKSILDLHIPSMHELKVANMEEKPQQEYQDLLIQCISQHLGFSKGRPIAACIIYKCLRQWHSFEVDKNNIFYRIIQTIGQAIETQEDKNNEALAYWLSTTSTLLLLLQNTLKQDEPNCLSFLFNQQLTAYVEKIYSMIRDNLKDEISPLINLCIQAPRDFKSDFQDETNDSQDTLIAYWQTIVIKMDSFLNMLKSYNVPPFLVRKIFTQIFSFINARLFNSIQLIRECCSFSNAEYVNAGLSKLSHWCSIATEEYAGSASDELKHIREAVGFLIHGTNAWYWDEKYDTNSRLSPDVISHMKVLMESDNVESIPFMLLVDDSSIPFSVDDLCKSMDEINVEDVEPPPLICDNSSFSFLMSRTKS